MHVIACLTYSIKTGTTHIENTLAKIHDINAETKNLNQVSDEKTFDLPKGFIYPKSKP